MFSVRCSTWITKCMRTLFQELDFNHCFTYSFSQISSPLCRDEEVSVSLPSPQWTIQSFQLT